MIHYVFKRFKGRKIPRHRRIRVNRVIRDKYTDDNTDGDDACCDGRMRFLTWDGIGTSHAVELLEQLQHLCERASSL